MKSQVFYILLFLSVLCSCEDRLKFLDDNNQEPEILLITSSDSLKTSLKNGSDRYSLHLSLSDPEADLKKLDFIFTRGSGTFFFDGNPIGTNTTPIDQVGQMVLLFEPATDGLIEMELVLYDDLNKSADADFELFVFANLAPIADFEVTKISVPTDRVFEFDASKSFDQDKNFGGGISSYKWDINGTQFVTNQPIIRQELSQGNYEIKLTVYDNDGKASKTVTEIKSL